MNKKGDMFFTHPCGITTGIEFSMPDSILTLFIMINLLFFISKFIYGYLIFVVLAIIIYTYFCKYLIKEHIENCQKCRKLKNGR